MDGFVFLFLAHTRRMTDSTAVQEPFDPTESIKEVKIEAPINIALIKYWGKRNEDLILPLNDSVSININALTATTTVTVGPHIEEDSVVLNGKEVAPEGFARFSRVFQEVREINKRLECALHRKRTHNGQPKTELSNDRWHICVVSETNFPVAAGLASSAAGFAAIAFGLGQIFDLEEDKIVRLARIGSGSACRSIKSGFVHWVAGVNEKDDSDSYCETIAPASHWPTLRAVIIVLNELEKQVGSSAGMRNTAQTSTLMHGRVKDVVPKRVKDLIDAINSKDFEKLAKITMAESNQLHAVCFDSDPPLNYLNPDSHQLIAFVLSFNEAFGVKLAYTFDAGPNCCLILEEETMPSLFHCLRKRFKFDYGLLPKDLSNGSKPENDANSLTNLPWSEPREIPIKNIICSEVGIDPKVLSISANGDHSSSS